MVQSRGSLSLRQRRIRAPWRKNTRTGSTRRCCARSPIHAFLSALSPKRFEDDPRLPAFQAGMQAFAERRSIAENPHAFDSVDHLAWECGWSEAREANKQR